MTLSSGEDGNKKKQENALSTSLREVTQKVEASLLESIRYHTTRSQNDNSDDDYFEPKHGLDFLDAKNSLLLSYLIELTYNVRQQLIVSRNKSNNTTNTTTASSMSMDRLMEMKIALDKMIGLDKKLRYQIDKLLTAASNSQTYATAGVQHDNEDPLHFRPNADALVDDNDESSSSDSDNDNYNRRNNKSNNKHSANDDDDENNVDSDDDDDDDLAAARQTLAMVKVKKSAKKSSNSKSGDDDNDDNYSDNDDGIYRAPHLQAVPYGHDAEERKLNREKRLRRTLRASEVAQTIRNQYTDIPEQDDIHGGTQVGFQRVMARKIATKHAEKEKYEEDSMIRLTTTRLEKQERKRMMRDEISNLNAISDLNNLAKEATAFGFGGSSRNDDDDDDNVKTRRRSSDKKRKTNDTSERYSNGVRMKKQQMDRDGRLNGGGEGGNKRGGKSIQPKNSFQAALYGDGGKQQKKNKKR